MTCKGEGGDDGCLAIRGSSEVWAASAADGPSAHVQRRLLACEHVKPERNGARHLHALPRFSAQIVFERRRLADWPCLLGTATAQLAPLSAHCRLSAHLHRIQLAVALSPEPRNVIPLHVIARAAAPTTPARTLPEPVAAASACTCVAPPPATTPARRQAGDPFAPTAGSRARGRSRQRAPSSSHE